MFALISNEAQIKSHESQVIVLTDCIGLSQILRSSNNNSRLLEFAVFLGTFSNLSVRYAVGASLFFADLITRQFNRIHLENDKAKLSEMWGQLQPPVKKEHYGSVISPEMLTDLLISKPLFGEYLDVFSKRKFYSQSLTRYHGAKNGVMDILEPIPTELSFLADLYAGWNGSKMSAAQFNDIVRSIKNFPAKHLSKRIDYSNLNALRKTLFDVNLRDELLLVLKRKYFPHLCFQRSKISANQLLGEMDLPSEVANIISKAWKANGHSGEELVIKSSPVLEQEPGELLNEAEVDSHVASESGNVEAKTVGVGCRVPRIAQCHMMSNDSSHDSRLAQFLEAIEKGAKLSDEHWLSILGISEAQLRDVLLPVAEHILSIFSYLNSGRVLKNAEAHHFDGVVPNELIDTWQAGKQPDPLTLLKLLIIIVVNFQSNRFFFSNPIVHVPYSFHQEQTLRINFSPHDWCFEVFTKHNLSFEGFASVKLNIDFSCILDQMIAFEKDTFWENLEFDIPFTKPPVHYFVSFVVHNLSNDVLLIPANALLGRFKIFALLKHVVYKPILVQQEEFDKCAEQEQFIKTFNARENLCLKLSSLLKLKSQDTLNGQFVDQMSVQEKQVRVTAFLPKDVKGRVKFDFRRLLDNLNTVLLAQYLQKSENCLSKDDVIELQRSDPVLKDIIDKVINEKQVDDKFVVKDKILFKLSLIYGIQVFRLCLPLSLAKEILFILHSNKSAHLGISNLKLKFRSNFWCRYLEDALKSVKNACLICRLNSERKELAVKGVTRRNQNDLTPGRFWQADILYMPPSSEGHRFILH